MSESDITNLISELKQLKLRELQVLATLESIVSNQQDDKMTTSHLYSVEHLLQHL
jgi:hypothetical protein